MSNRGYAFEHEVERELMSVCNQTADMQLAHRTHRVPTSGAMRGEKGDIRTMFPWDSPQWMIECKSRRQKSKRGQCIRLQSDWIKKCFNEACTIGMVPVFAFSFKGKTKNRIWFMFWKSKLPSCITDEYQSLEVKANKTSVTIYSNVISGPYERGFTFDYNGEKFVCVPLPILSTILRNLFTG